MTVFVLVGVCFVADVCRDDWWCRLQRALPGLVLFCLKRFLISV